MGEFVQLRLQLLPSPGKMFMHVQRRYCLHSVWNFGKGNRFACFVFHSLERFGIHHNSTTTSYMSLFDHSNLSISTLTEDIFTVSLKHTKF